MVFRHRSSLHLRWMPTDSSSPGPRTPSENSLTPSAIRPASNVPTQLPLKFRKSSDDDSTADGEAAVAEEAEGMLLLAADASAPPPLDTRISIEELEEVQTAALSSQGSAAGPAAASGPAAAPGDSDIPEDWATRGLLNTVDPKDTKEILRLCERVDTRLHAAAQAQDLTALRALLAAGASPAALDWEGRTPLHLCVALRLMEPFKVLLGAPGAADVRDASGWPLLHAALLHGWRAGARAALAAGARVAPRCMHAKLYYWRSRRYPNVSDQKFCSSFRKLPIDIVMESGDMEMLETILTFAERDGVVNSLNAYGRTALRTAILDSNLPAVQVLLQKGASPHMVSHLNETALHMAVHDSIILKYLLDNTDVPSSLDYTGLAPLHKAVCSKNPESVRLLLDKFNNVLVKTEPDENTPLHYAAFRASNGVAEIILEKSDQAINQVNKHGDTPLHLAVKCNNKGLAALLLQKGAVLSTKDSNGATVLELISSHFFDASHFFDQVFDLFIFNKKLGDDDFKINVSYKVLTKLNCKDMSQIEVIEKFVECGRSKALLHPLIESLLHLKWKNYLLLFYATSCVYLIFLTSFNIFSLKLFHYEDVDNRNGTANSSSVSNTSSMSGDETPVFHGGMYWLLIAIIYISILVLLLQESIFIYLKKRRYFGSVESWVKLVGLVLCAVTPPLCALVPEPWPRHAACAALLLSWLQAMFLVSRFPRWGYYVLVFEKVAINILKILVSAVFLVIAFSICFMIQYRSAAPFNSPFAAFVKTLVMMSSEFEYEDLFGKDHEEQLRHTGTFVRLLFVIFVIFVAIVLMNVMIGVAVSDINDMNETSNIKRLEKQVELLSTLEVLIYHGVLSKWLTKLFGDKIHYNYMHTRSGLLSDWRVDYTRIHDWQPKRRRTRPILTLHNAIVEITRKNDQRFKELNVDTKIDTLYEAILSTDRAADDAKGDKNKENKSETITLENQIKLIIEDLSKLTRENEEMKRAVRDLTSTSADILKSINEIAANISCRGTLRRNTDK